MCSYTVHCKRLFNHVYISVHVLFSICSSSDSHLFLIWKVSSYIIKAIAWYNFATDLLLIIQFYVWVLYFSMVDVEFFFHRESEILSLKTNKMAAKRIQILYRLYLWAYRDTSTIHRLDQYLMNASIQSHIQLDRQKADCAEWTTYRKWRNIYYSEYKWLASYGYTCGIYTVNDLSVWTYSNV